MNKTNQTSKENFFLNRGVKECKDEGLKTRLQTLIHAKGMSEPDFYHKIGLSRQHWYELSWGIWPCPIDIKVKIARELEVDSSVIFYVSKNLTNTPCFNTGASSQLKNKKSEVELPESSSLYNQKLNEGDTNDRTKKS